MKSRIITNKLAAFFKGSVSAHATKGPAVGLDIGPKEIKVIAGDIEASIPTPEGAVLDGVIVNVKGVAEAVKELFRSKGITNKDVITAVSGKGVVLRLTNVPSIGPEGIKDIIKDEASKYIVFAGSELLTDFYPIEEISEEGSKKLRVLSVAAKKEVIDSYVETIKLAELNLQAIDVGSLSLARAVFSQESLSSGVVVLAAVEYDAATIFIFKDGKIHYLHNVDLISELNSEIESIISYCKSEFGEGVEVKKIISTDLKDVSIAKGLALRETKEAKFPIKINLLPLEEIRIKEFNNQAFQFLKVLGVVVSILVLYFFFLRFQTWLTFRDIAAIQDDLKKPNPVLDKLLEVERMDKLYTLEMTDQERILLKAKAENWGEVLQEIKRIIPKKAYLMSIKSDEKDTVTFKGETSNQNSVFDFVRSLKGSRYFEDIKLEESKDEETKEGTRAYFVIKCLLRVESSE